MTTRETYMTTRETMFKWIGGKKWLRVRLAEKTRELINNETTYIEPFVGGLGAFLAILPELKQVNKIILNDINKNIIEIYRLTKSNPESLIEKYLELELAFEKQATSISGDDVYDLPKDKIKEALGDDVSGNKKKMLKGAVLYFNNTKKIFNELKKKSNLSDEETLEISATLIFLQSHSFNGIYRENLSGEYNVPFNWSPHTERKDRRVEIIRELSELFNKRNAIFENMDVFTLLDKYRSENAFVYLDPPYLNTNENTIEETSRLIADAWNESEDIDDFKDAEKTLLYLNKGISKSENKYNKDHFGVNEQKKLLSRLVHGDWSFLYSNHELSTIIKYFDGANLSHVILNRKNIISSKADGRGNDKEEILGWKRKM